MEKFEAAMRAALQAAEPFVGATAPNPPVGASALCRNGQLLLSAAHQKAGTPHAEARLLEMAEREGKLAAIETVVVTLEPCNHHGRTPPCTEAILKQKQIKRVVFGCRDPNPHVAGLGAEKLRAGGLEVIEGVLEKDCRFLIRSFVKHALTGLPYVTIKAAFNGQGSMIPPSGQKTFTSQASLKIAHEMRKRADAIWTGSGTILADNPEFTVRLVPDHPGKNRFLLLSDRRRRVPQEWISRAEKNAFSVHYADSIQEGLEFLGKNNALEVLVEAGPSLRQAWLDSGVWDESVVFLQGKNSQADTVDIQFRNSGGKQ